MNKNVPKLRFKEFNDEWRATKLGEVIDYKKGFAFKSKDYADNGVRVIKISDTTTSSVSEEGNTFVKYEMLEEFKEWALKTEDIIISTVGSRPPLYSSMVGKVVKIPEFCDGSLLNQNLVKLVPKDIINTFLYSLLKKTRYTKHIENICRGNANQVSITLEELFDFKVNIPSLQEQEKIADFFTILDSLIEEQDRKVSDLELYKKGMMQKIFSQEIRFKDENGCEYPEWQEKELNSLANKITEKNKDFKVNNVISNSAKGGLIKQREFFDKDIANQSNIDGYYIIKNGDFVYNPRKSNYAPYGPINMYKIQEDGVVSPLYLCFRVNEKVNKEYIELYFKSTCWHRYIYKNSDQGVRHDRVSIKDSEFMKTVVLLPLLVEQRKIVEFLYNVSELEEFEKQKLVDLKEVKKGLLQQMFV